SCPGRPIRFQPCSLPGPADPPGPVGNRDAFLPVRALRSGRIARDFARAQLRPRLAGDAVELDAHQALCTDAFVARLTLPRARLGDWRRIRRRWRGIGFLRRTAAREER